MLPSRMNFARQRAAFLSKSEAPVTKRRLHITSASQLIENTARKRAFYSRAPKVEVYEDKGQSAILLAAQTHVFPLSLLPLACSLPPAGPNRNTLARIFHPFPGLTANSRPPLDPACNFRLSTLNHSPRTAPRAHRTPAGITRIPWPFRDPSARPQPINYKLIARGKSRTP